ncbi:MAG: polyphosphate kinase 2 family protein [Pseudomonadales bacterium]|nr:polyphosphate kinase 2 family protein [Pseudomonadales bacterium]
MTLPIGDFRYRPGARLDAYPTLWKVVKDAPDQLRASIERLSELQEVLYAHNRRSVLLVFQGMDAAGKDSTIKYVTSGVNPAGFQVFNFSQPTRKELDHSYLWAYWQAMPERGRIGIFNRSYYEEVLVVRVHPEIIESRPLPHETIDETFWANRLDDIRNLERHLAQSGTLVLKFFLNVSRGEQKSRLLARLKRPDKHWKYDPRDLDERDHWNDYQRVYQAAIEATHTEESPWYVVPADHKWTMRALVAKIICHEVGRLDIHYPPPAPDHEALVQEAIRRLESEG